MRLSDADRRELFAAIEDGEAVPSRFLKLLFPDATNVTSGYELVYRGKLRREDVYNLTLPAPLQAVRTMPDDAPPPLVSGWSNKLIFGDNLQVLRELADPTSPHSLAGKVRLIYIDPPFATRQDMKGKKGQQAYQDKVAGAQFIEFLRRRLILLHDLLTDDGSIYVHLDYRMSSAIKQIMDEVFERRFLNQISWVYGESARGAKANSGQFARNHDDVLLYGSGPGTFFKRVYIEREYTHREARKKGFRLDESSGRWFKTAPKGDYTDESIAQLSQEGRTHTTKNGNTRIKYWLETRGDLIVEHLPIGDAWTDIADAMHMSDDEDTDYPNQKPEALLRRIIEASSEEDDIVLDCFAGSGTTATAAEQMNRRWVSIDCSKFAVYTTQMRLLSRLKGGQTPRSFTLYNAGLYDYDLLRYHTNFETYTQIALGLFHATPHQHTYGQLETQGRMGKWPVLVYNFMQHADPTAQLDYQTLHDLHHASWGQLPERVYLVVPGALLAFSPTEYHVPDSDTTFVLLRVPQSVLELVRQGKYDTLMQPQSLLDLNDLDTIYRRADVNNPQRATGFDFMTAPEVVARYHQQTRPGQLPMPQYAITLERFSSAREGAKLEATAANPYPAFAMLLVDPDYRGGVFKLGYHADAEEMKKHHYTAYLPDGLSIGEIIKVVYIDIYGNEYTAEMPRNVFDNGETRGEDE